MARLYAVMGLPASTWRKFRKGHPASPVAGSRLALRDWESTSLAGPRIFAQEAAFAC